MTEKKGECKDGICNVKQRNQNAAGGLWRIPGAGQRRM